MFASPLPECLGSSSGSKPAPSSLISPCTRPAVSLTESETRLDRVAAFYTKAAKTRFASAEGICDLLEHEAQIAASEAKISVTVSIEDLMGVSPGAYRAHLLEAVDAAIDTLRGDGFLAERFVTDESLMVTLSGWCGEPS